ncbi:NAD-dependent epimerase/dehydratase family protein [Candidatus Bathyarchaeota archaeon]|nr:NAD-dependent epimerase/dehydratase family protein [Candidatus Bathyarchaeota archaeon]
MRRILVTGAFGQIGSELVPALRSRYGCENVVAAGHHTKPPKNLLDQGPYAFLDVRDRSTLTELVRRYDVGVIYHLAAILSAVGEHNPQLAWDVNVNGLYNILEVAREYGVEKVFHPSSIAVFGPKTFRVKTPQDSILDPTTIYGVSKAAGEYLCDYYFTRFGLDVRGIRYPGIISSEALPGGGTTDYAVAMFYEAVEHGRYVCYVREDTVLPMVYMPDAIDAAVRLMDADLERLKHHSNFNISSMSFSAKELACEIKRHIPNFHCDYDPDPVRQRIADSWPESIDDTAAREEWGWNPKYDLRGMVADMINKLSVRKSEGRLYRKPR